MPIHITRWGQTGPRVVFVHGSAQGSQVGGDGHFSAQQPMANGRWQLIVPDRPGHGRSRSRGYPDDAELDADWVSDLLDDGAHLVGHSFGACVALAAASKRPSAVRSLTLIEPGMHILATGAKSVRRFGLQMLLVKHFSVSAASRARRFARLVGIPPEIADSKSSAELSRMGQGITRLRLPSKDTLQRQLQAISREGIPLLVVSGGWNPAFEATADTVASLGSGRRWVINSPHHFPHLVSDEFNQLLASFMQESGAKRPLPS